MLLKIMLVQLCVVLNLDGIRGLDKTTSEFVKGQGEDKASPDKTSSDVSFSIYKLDYFFKMTDYFLKHHSRQ